MTLLPKSIISFYVLALDMMNQFLLIGPQTLKYKQNFLKCLEDWKEYNIENNRRWPDTLYMC